MTTVIEFINHYQRSINKSLDSEERLLHCIGKLYKLDVTVQHLQETGIGRTVNSLRKYDGEVGIAAKTLVTKWKAMVAAEESDEGGDSLSTNRMSSEKDDDDINQDAEKSSHKSSRSNSEKHRHKSSSNSFNHSNSSTSSSTSKSKHKSNNSNNRITDDKTLLKNDKSLDASQKEIQSHHNKNTSNNNSHNNHNSTNNVNSGSSSKRKLHKSDDEDSTNKVSSSHDRSKSRRTDDLPNISDKSDHHSNRTTSTSKSEHRSSTTNGRSSSSKSESNVRSSSSSKSKHKDKHRSKSDRISSAKEDTHTKASSSSASSVPSRKEKLKLVDKNSVKKENINNDDLDNDDDDDDEENFEIDYSMGASFDDALQMMSMPSTSKGSLAKKSKEHTLHKPDTKKIFKKSTPSLLSQSMKLEPLPDITSDITSEIVSITKNYRPMPANPLVMECVMPTNGRPIKRHMTDEEAFGASISSKNLRTKVYSGVKTGAKMNVPSLYDLCIRSLQENIDRIEFTGGVPFDILKPILERASPQQLFQLEDYNRYLLEDSDVLWEYHCKRKFRGYNRQEMESWREMFLRCQDEQDAKLKSLTANIKQSQVQSVPVKQTKLAYVDSAAKPPRNIQKKQIQFGTDRKLIVSPATRVASLNGITNNLAQVGDTRLRVAAGTRDTAQASAHGRPRKAPLMQKTLLFMKGRFKR